MDEKENKVDWQEFLSAAANRLRLINEYNLKLAFNSLDDNTDGIITSEKL